MAWIESHQELARHPKTRRAARALGIGVPQMIGHLHLLWWWSLDFAEDGNLSAFDALDIADGALWEGEPQPFVDALIAVGFIDADPAEGLHLHDWADYAGRLVEQRRANAEKQRAWRERHKAQPVRTGDIPPPDPDPSSGDMSPNDNVTVTSPVRKGATVQYSTVPNHTIDLTPPTPPPAEEPSPPPEAADAAGAERPRSKPVTPTPKPDPVGDYRTVFDAIATHFNVPRLPWNFGREAKAVNLLLKAQPRAAPADFVAFLDYLQSVWPWSAEPTRLPKFSDAQAADHWPQWWALGRPTNANRVVSRNGKAAAPAIAIVKSWD